MQHPDIATRTFTTPQGSDECFQHFLAGFDISPQELLHEISDGIAARHGQAIPISSASPQQHAFLVELTRFIVVYEIRPGYVEVSTILMKHDAARPGDTHSFTAITTLPGEPRTDLHPDIAARKID